MLSSRRNLKRNLKLRCKKVCKIFDDSGKISTFKYIIWDGIKDRATFTFFFPFRMSCNIYFEKWLLKYFNVKCCLEDFFYFFVHQISTLKYEYIWVHIFYIIYASGQRPQIFFRISLWRRFLKCNWNSTNWNMINSVLYLYFKARNKVILHSNKYK